jgi:hypothetical protein
MCCALRMTVPFRERTAPGDGTRKLFLCMDRVIREMGEKFRGWGDYLRKK